MFSGTIPCFVCVLGRTFFVPQSRVKQKGRFALAGGSEFFFFFLPRPTSPGTINPSYPQFGSRRDRAYKGLVLNINDLNRIGYFKIVTVVDVSLWCPRVFGFVRSYICSHFLQRPFFFSPFFPLFVSLSLLVHVRMSCE
jgi:hypothetical protein